MNLKKYLLILITAFDCLFIQYTFAEQVNAPLEPEKISLSNTNEYGKSHEEQVLEVYDLCLAFETMYKKIDYFEAYITFLAKEGDQFARLSLNLDQVCKGKELMDQVRFLKENKNALINLSFNQLEEIKSKLKSLLQEITILKENAITERSQRSVGEESVYKEWVKIIFKILINKALINYFQEVPVFDIPLSIAQIYYSIQFGFSTCFVIGDISQHIVKKIC